MNLSMINKKQMTEHGLDYIQLLNNKIDNINY